MPSKKRKRGERETTPRPSSTGLLDLPLEVRQKIYSMVFELPPTSRYCEERLVGRSRVLKSCLWTILLLCRQIHAEAWPIFTNYCTFVFNHPLHLANQFLSFLPQQRLSQVKHVSLHEEVLSNKFNSFADLERFWWYYQDTISRLETLTFEVTTKRPSDLQPRYGIPGHLLSILLTLLDQGAPKAPKWNSKKCSQSLRMYNNLDLPADHEWRLRIGSIAARAWIHGVPFLAQLRIVVQRYASIQAQHLPLFDKQQWAVRNERYLQGPFETYIPPLLLRCRAHGLLPSNPNFTLGYSDTMSSLSCQLSPDTGVLFLTDLSNLNPVNGTFYNGGFLPVDVITFGGRWVDKRSGDKNGAAPAS